MQPWFSRERSGRWIRLLLPVYCNPVYSLSPHLRNSRNICFHLSENAAKVASIPAEITRIQRDCSDLRPRVRLWLLYTVSVAVIKASQNVFFLVISAKLG